MRYSDNLSAILWTVNIADYVSAPRSRTSAGVPVGFYPQTFCPDAPQDRPDTAVEALGGGTVGGATTPWYHAYDNNPSGGIHGGSYGMNGFLYSTELPQRQPFGYGPRNADLYPDYIENVNEASNFVAFADANWVDGWPQPTDAKPTNLDNYDGALGPNMHRFAIDRHDLVQNVSFVDGHAEAVTFLGLWELKWHQEYEYTGP